jgi:DMSO/TMAO reductase YedYZ heme-binding membrane subunit
MNIEEKIFLQKDSSWNSLQNVYIFIILNNLHYSVTCDPIDWSKKHNFQRQYFFELIIVALNVTLFNKIMKCTTKCNMKRSTTYKLNFILIVYFLLSKKAKLYATNVCRCENRSHRIWSFFEHKKCRNKINCSL